MKKILLLICFVSLISVVNAQLQWYNEVEKALQAAKISKKVIFVDVYAQDCSWCDKLEKETFKNSSFVNIAKEFIILKIDEAENASFRAKYKIHSFPTLLYLDANGEELEGRIKGYRPADVLVPSMQTVLDNNKRFETDVEKAFLKAKSSGKLLFVDMYEQDCSWCEKLEKETFKDTRFQETIKKFVFLKIDEANEQKFRVKYKIHAFPTLLFLDADGNVVERIKGFRPADVLVPIMNEVLGTKRTQKIHWKLDIEKAFKQAQASNKYIFIDFYTDWCSWCKKLDKETFTNEKVIKVISGYIALKVDGDVEVEFRKKYKIEGYPTMLIVTHTGRIIKRIVGYRPPEKLLEEIKQK